MPTTGATPLFALDAIALDLETTGLDAAQALIIEIGAVPVARGTLLADRAYQRLVDPGAPIPPRSTEVHGISDAMVRGAPRLDQLWAEFTDALADRVVIGHSTGYDLTVLAAEARRKGLAWKKPRALCVRLLALIVAPSLASHSLEALAGWLGLETGDRHRALGDAEAAGLIFLALVPRLQEKGIRTLAEAERACRGLGVEMDRHRGAGWEPPVSEPGDAPLGSVDTHAYRHRVGDVMAHPVVVVRPEISLEAAMRVMVDRSISSVLVTPSGQPGLEVAAYSVVTERDAMRRIAAVGAAALAEPVGSIGSSPVHTIRENAFLYRAVGRMSRIGTRHLGVRSDASALVGMVSARDLLKLRAGPALTLADTIEAAPSAADLALAWSTLPAVVRSLVAEDLDARIVSQIVSEEIRSMTRRAAVLAAAAMEAEGLGGPPCPFAVLVLGSGGRGESLLVPDQDNAIVFEAGDPGGSEDQWFAELGARLSAILDTAGIPYCTGGVMGKTPDWRGSIDTWKARIEGWIRNPRQEHLLNVDIFFDETPVHGALALGHALFAHAYDLGRGSPTFAKLLGERLSSVPSGLTMLGGFKSRDGRLDLKLHVLFPVASAARLLSIRHGVAERSTRARIEGLIARGIGSDTDLAAMLDAHGLGLALILAQQSRDIAAGLKPSTYVDLGQISRQQKAELKRALGHLGLLHSLLRDLMFDTGGEAARTGGG